MNTGSPRSAWKTFLRVVEWIVGILVVLYIGLILYRIPAVQEEHKTADVVAAIHAQKLTMKDVTGENLPPKPDLAKVDATIEGVDVNGNGIRDDVELAIFKKYPSNTKLRAAALQYALAAQKEFTNATGAVWVAVMQERNRALLCIADVAPDSDRTAVLKFVLDREVDTNNREALLKKAEAEQSQFAPLTGPACDLFVP